MERIEKKRRKLNPKEPSKVAKDFSEFWDSRVIGQGRAKKTLMNAVELAHSPKRDKDKPILSTIFLGPSGVGKTLAAEVLAEFMFGNKHSLVKISGPDYSEQHAVSLLDGSPPGYAGSDVSQKTGGKGSFPVLSVWNVFKYDYLKTAGKEEKKPEGGGDAPTRSENIRRKAAILDALRDYEFDASNRMKNLLKAEVWYREDLQSFLEKSLEQSETVKANIQKNFADFQKNVHMAIQIFLAAARDVDKAKAELAAEQKRQILLTQDASGKGCCGAPRSDKKDDFESVKDDLLGIILVDELEKGHQTLHNLLLEILDKGRLTLKDGVVVNLRNVILIMTGNIGEYEITKKMSGKDENIGFISGDTEEADSNISIYEIVKAKYFSFFSAPFRGRIDELKVFRPHKKEEVRLICELQVIWLKKEMLPIVIDVDKAVIDFIAEEAFDNPELGARLLKSKIKKFLRDPILRETAKGELRDFNLLEVGIKDSGDQDQKSEIVFYTSDLEVKDSDKEDFINMMNVVYDRELIKIHDKARK